MHANIGKKTLDLLKKNEVESHELYKKLRKKLDFIKKDDKNQLEMYKKIVEHMAESVWIGDKDEKTVYANPNFCHLIGYTLEEMIGVESYHFRDEESTKVVKQNNTLRQVGEASRYEGVLRAKDGTLIPVYCSGTPIPGGGTVGIMTDLRQLKSLEENRKELRKINKMKDEFISVVGHELRTPLTAIKGYLSMIADGDMGEINPLIHSSLEQSITQTNRLIDLVNEMLDISKIESGNMKYHLENASVQSIFDSVYASMKVLVEQKGLNFIVETPESDVIIYVDKNKLKQVLINLISNAIKFTPNGSIRLSGEKVGENIKISVIDTGIGIPEDKQKSIFDKFYQVDSYIQRKTDGVGLGLSISQNIIKDFGSIIEIDSEVDHGTQFHFTLPVQKQ